jgi:acyl-CoA reductase-like NAD-dependent aldehyde dehydrogenase
MTNTQKFDFGNPSIVAWPLINGDWFEGRPQSPIQDPYTGQVVGSCAISTPEDVDRAVLAATAAKDAMAVLPGYKRAELLHAIAEEIRRQKASLAATLTLESGKPIRDSLGEIDRCIDTFLLSAGEAIRIEGRHVPLDGSPMGAGKYAFLLRFPVGVVAAITPFNAPVNLTAHKIAPAIAAGNATVLKPPPQTPLTIHRMIEIVQQSGLPAGAINVVHGGAEIGRALVTHPGVDFITFTGSSRAGLDIKALSGLKRVALELGGNGITVVHQDADVEVAATNCARNAMRLAGQSCISVQNVFAHESVCQDLLQRVTRKVAMMKFGDPKSEETEVGTLIDEAAARRVEAWIRAAADGGAEILTGGRRHGAGFEPTVLTNVKTEMDVVCNEVFGPALSIIPYTELDSVVRFVNASRFGLQCGIFTTSNAVTFDLIRRLRTGGIIVNGTSTWRTDQLAYGGVRDSGMGREGPRYAIEDMTDQRLVLFNL